MRTLNRLGYIELRELAYKNAGILGDAAERFELVDLNTAYDAACEGLDAIDTLGYSLGYLDAETNEYIPANDESMQAKVIETQLFDVRLNNGVSYHVECGLAEIDALAELIGENNIVTIDTIPNQMKGNK